MDQHERLRQFEAEMTLLAFTVADEVYGIRPAPALFNVVVAPGLLVTEDDEFAFVWARDSREVGPMLTIGLQPHWAYQKASLGAAVVARTVVALRLGYRLPDNQPRPRPSSRFRGLVGFRRLSMWSRAIGSFAAATVAYFLVQPLVLLPAMTPGLVLAGAVGLSPVILATRFSLAKLSSLRRATRVDRLAAQALGSREPLIELLQLRKAAEWGATRGVRRFLTTCAYAHRTRSLRSFVPKPGSLALSAVLPHEEPLAMPSGPSSSHVAARARKPKGPHRHGTFAARMPTATTGADQAPRRLPQGRGAPAASDSASSVPATDARRFLRFHVRGSRAGGR